MYQISLVAAYIAGMKYALREFEPDVILEMDADLSHDPNQITNFIHEIEKGADFIIGSRYIKGGSIPQEWALHRKIFSVVGNLIVRFGFMKLRITDWTGGYRAIKAWIIKNALVHVKNYSGYVFQIALLDSAIKSGARIKEIPIEFRERKIGHTKIGPWDIIEFVWTAFKLRDKRLKLKRVKKQR